ncbi:MAG: tetratricopeptide repeat protein [Pseudomonadota bacterium]
MEIIELDLKPGDDLVVTGIDSANWVLSYPAVMPLLPPAGAAWARDIRESAAEGALAEAVLFMESAENGSRDGEWHLFRANLLLRIGRADEAQADLAEALKRAPDHAGVHTLAAVVASVLGQKDRAADHARTATRLAPDSAPAWLALSYTQQSAGDLPGALASTGRALAAEPRNGIARVREAELHLAQGHLPAARISADQAVALLPDSAIAQGNRALVALLQRDARQAQAGFTEAVRLNPSDANARFGLGLAYLLQGKTELAKAELETAVTRAPDNALFLAYLGRVQMSQGDYGKARENLRAAARKDPNNAAVRLFMGQLKLLENRPASALDEIRLAGELNAARRVYRDSSLLDDDLALNHIDQSRAYQALGFHDLALSQASQATEGGCCPATLRNLADQYASRPRGLQARRSLALQSLFDAPLGQLPLELDVAQGSGGAGADVPNHALPMGIEPRPAGLNEYSTLFTPDGWQMAVDGNLGDYGTWGEQVRLAGRAGALGLGFAQQIQTSDGVDGKALDNRNVQLLMQGRLSPVASAFLEYRQADSEREEEYDPFDALLYSTQDLDERTRVARIGLGMKIGAGSNLRLLYARQWRDQDTLVTFPNLAFSLNTVFPTRSEMPEIQFQQSWEHYSLTLGASRFQDDGSYTSGGFSTPSDITSGLAYGYGTWRPSRDLAVTLGLGRVDFEQEFGVGIHYKRTMPKFGLHWSPFAGAHLRIAALESVAMPKTGGAALEPVEVAGVQQWFGNEQGTVVRRANLHWEQPLTNTLSLTLGLGNDRLSVPINNGIAQLDEQYERWTRAGLYWRLPQDLPGSWEGGLRLTYDRLEQDRPNLVTDSNDLAWQRASHWTLGLQLSGPRGLGLVGSLTRAQAEQQFIPIFGPNLSDDQQFWMTDLAVTKRLARGQGQLSLGIRNASNQDMGNYQEADIQAPRFSPSRFTYARLQWRFD